MTRNSMLKAVAVLAVLFLAAPNLMRAADPTGSPRPAGAPGAVAATLPQAGGGELCALDLLLPAPHRLDGCTSHPCTRTTNCTQLCQGPAFCMSLDGISGFCVEK
jgi:hypothetical protein